MCNNNASCRRARQLTKDLMQMQRRLQESEWRRHQSDRRVQYLRDLIRSSNDSGLKHKADAQTIMNVTVTPMRSVDAAEPVPNDPDTVTRLRKLVEAFQAEIIANTAEIKHLRQRLAFNAVEQHLAAEWSKDAFPNVAPPPKPAHSIKDTAVIAVCGEPILEGAPTSIPRSRAASSSTVAYTSLHPTISTVRRKPAAPGTNPISVSGASVRLGNQAAAPDWSQAQGLNSAPATVTRPARRRTATMLEWPAAGRRTAANRRPCTSAIQHRAPFDDSWSRTSRVHR
ncbi:Uncharacterized protein PBTT_03717 [Plasmodiophora brassicae]